MMSERLILLRPELRSRQAALSVEPAPIAEGPLVVLRVPVPAVSAAHRVAGGPTNTEQDEGSREGGNDR